MSTKIFFRVHVFFENSHKNLRPAPEHIIEWLRNHGLNVGDADFSDAFEVSFEINNEADKRKKKEILDRYLLAASLRNSMGFLITDCSNDPKYNAWLSVPPTEESLKKFFKKCGNHTFLDTVRKLREFYAQVEQRPKIILGVALLEELFDTKPEHILNESEKKEISEVVKKLNWVKNKKEKTITVLNDTNFMAIDTRNNRMAKEIAKYLQENESKTLKRIKKIYQARNSGAHAVIEKDQTESEDVLKEVDVIFEMYLIHKFRFAKSAGMQF
jgi:hypothetical protein